jgi:hypothetical protein
MRDALRSAALAVLAVVAIAFAAATLDSTAVAEPAGSDGTGTGTGAGTGAGAEPVPLPSQPASPGEVLVVPFLREILLVVLLLCAVVILAYAIVNWRRTVALAIGGVVLLVALFVLLQLLPPASRSALPPLAPGGGGGSAETSRTRPPLFAVLAVLGLVLAGAAVVLGRRDRDDETPAADETPDEDTERAAAVGHAAGRAADRMEAQPDAENEVYRAWREMTDLLDVSDPDTSTPGEFAAAAIEAGLGSEDVAELTRLFEDARYGCTEPSGAEEERAVAVFRRIEARYAEADA